MPENVLKLAQRLEQARKPFVLATVVWCERPTSAKPGARALIQADGSVSGWIGGSCAQPVVVREALRLLHEGGDPYLLRLGASEAGLARAGPGVRVFPMTCSSGGVLDIYMEPHLPQPRLFLIGASPVVTALARLAPVLDFAIVRVDESGLLTMQPDERSAILVATHGEYDEEAVARALRSPAWYVGMVGSRRRAEACRQYLREAGFQESVIARLRAPAGLDVGAVTPEEIAASILAELVQVRRRQATQKPEMSEPASASAASATPATAIDPVCGMIVEVAAARQCSTYQGQDFYFCCPACKRLFESDPQRYLAPKAHATHER
ncbi:XdhC family protein [Thermogemmatispora sp.]|uniref:XdhC family protein n=1 Tax=Thermogemmatispora sp. TaxID=1968838 RepID=UPI001DD98634|nr:XdhC family protein [Thermogemmatispora sp.]MBX5449618.1 XdhC family protein [Thermogemmatispora sp.]